MTEATECMRISLECKWKEKESREIWRIPGIPANEKNKERQEKISRKELRKDTGDPTGADVSETKVK